MDTNSFNRTLLVLFAYLGLLLSIFDTSYAVDESLTDSSSKIPNSAYVENSAMPHTQSLPKINLALAGKLMPFIQSFALTSEKSRAVRVAISSTASISDILILATLGWATVPIVQYPLAKLARQKGQSNEEGKSIDTTAQKRRGFRDNVIFHFADNISQIAKIALGVYTLDCVSVVLPIFGFHLHNWNEATIILAAQIFYLLWATSRLMVFKRYLIRKSVSSLGKASIYDHLLDFVFVVIAGTFIIDILPVNLGLGLKSILTFGGIGTLIISLAVKDLVAEFLHGLWLFASENFYAGDEILLGDNTRGIVKEIDWMHTTIRGFDELEIIIPNSQVAGGRITNASRMRKCQVKQIFRFKHSDMQKIPKFIADLKLEIKNCCPEVISDGSRPFRIHLRNVEDTHLAVVLDMHFDLKPIGDEYLENKQKVLLGAGRIMERHQIELVQEPDW